MPQRDKPLPVRLYLGIHDHSPARRSEWVLACILIAWGWILLKPADAFADNPSWAQMAAMMSEDAWGRLAVAIGAFRLIAGRRVGNRS